MYRTEEILSSEESSKNVIKNQLCNSGTGLDILLFDSFSFGNKPEKPNPCCFTCKVCMTGFIYLFFPPLAKLISYH